MWVRWVMAGLALLSAGCELRLEVTAEFDRHAGGRLGVTVAADEDLRARAEAAGADPLGDLAATGRDLAADGWRVDDQTDAGGTREVSLSARFDGPDTFNRLAADLAGALSAPEGDLLAPLTVSLDEEHLEVSGSAGLQPTAAVGELGLTPEQVVATLLEEGGFTYLVRVDLPGEVLDATTTVGDGGTLTWTVQPGQQVAIRAVGRRPGPPVLPLAIGAVLGLAFAALVLRRLVVIRRQ